MYIPRPAKLLFLIDDGWGKLLTQYGNAIPEWTQLVVERMLACGTPAMGLRRYCCASPHCTHTKYICYSCKGKGCSACGMKATEQWIAEQQHILPDCEWQHITFTMPDKLWPLFANNWPLLYDHRTQQHRRQVLSQEEMPLRYISHIPSRHFKMVRYYGFLSNRKRGELLPKIYASLEMEVKPKPAKPGYAVLMKQFTNVDPYQCVLCGARMAFSSAEVGSRAEVLLAQR
ncbi:transposase, partial [Salmonella enterica subsp. enterica]|nr:transposase [Salmonella enterica subsp. enterica serovar Wandsworth]